MFQRHPVQNGCAMLATTVTKDRAKIFQDPACAREAIETLYKIREHRPFQLFGFVIMHDHAHFLLQIQEPETISKIMNVYKRAVAFNIGQGPIWQSRFHLILPDNSPDCLEYIHQNPVRAGLCNEAIEYPWSSLDERWETDDLGWR